MFCAFFKQGLCKKGADKCKFSHDPDVERKSAKRSLYTDVDKDKENDNMEDWDDEKLAEVIGKKHGAEKTNETAIVRNVLLFSYLYRGVGTRGGRGVGGQMPHFC